MRIMMSAAGSAVAPGIIKHLKSLGHYVIGHDVCDLGFATTLCNEFHKSPPVSETRNYLHFLVDFIGEFDLYIPFLDEEMLTFCGAILEDHIKIVWSGRDECRPFLSKLSQNFILSGIGLPVPTAIASKEAIIKPEHGRGGKGIYRPHRHSSELIQQVIEGDEYTVDMLFDRGKLLFAVPRRRIQASGVSIVGKIEMDPAIIGIAKRFGFKFHGPINMQVIRQKTTGVLYIIEINPRLSGSCIFTVMAGWDILADTIRLFEGKAFIPPSDVREITIRRHYVEEIV